MTKTRSKNAPKHVPAPNLPPLNLLAPSRELEESRERLKTDHTLTAHEKEYLKRRIRVLEHQLTIPGLNGGGKRRTRRRRSTKK